MTPAVSRGCSRPVLRSADSGAPAPARMEPAAPIVPKKRPAGLGALWPFAIRAGVRQGRRDARSAVEQPRWT